MPDQETPSSRPTAASASAAAEAAQEAAGNALKVSEAQSQQLTKLGSEQVALAQALSLVRDRVEKLATGLDATVVVSKLDGLSARLETMEQRTAGETADWAPVIKAQNERLHKFGEQFAQLTAKLEDAATASLGDDDEDTLTGRVDQAFNQIQALYEAMAAFGKGKVTRNDVDTLSRDLAEVALQVKEMQSPAMQAAHDGDFDHQFEERLRPLVARRATFEQDLLRRLENLERRAVGMSEPTGGGNTASAKVLELMRLIPNIGKEKDFESKQAKFKFRGIDQAMDWTGWAMREVGLTLRTKVLGRETTHDSVTKQGNNGDYTQLWTSTILTMRYVFVDPATGHEHEFEMVGEGRDVADKSASKAAAMACKYALFQALMIPVEGLNDADSDSERPVVEDSPGRRASQGKITPAQAVNEYVNRGYQGDAAGTNDGGPNADPAIGRPGNAYTMPTDEGDLMQRAAFAARYLIQAQGRPVMEALPDVQAAKARIEQLGIGDYEVPFDLRDEACGKLSVLVAATLQSLGAAVNRAAGAQGVTRQGQQSGDGARAAVEPMSDNEPGSEYEGSEEEYLDALKTLGSKAPNSVQVAAERIAMRWEAKHRV